MAASAPIRVLIAEDSPTARYHLARIINAAPGLQVVGEARDGKEAVEMAASLLPDVISMDIRMPALDGLEATRRIMAQHPTPIVVVSALLEADVELSFKAIEAGALAVVGKPSSRGTEILSDRGRQLTTTLAAMAGVSVVRRWRRESTELKTVGNQKEIPSGNSLLVTHPSSLDVIAIGTSAGGPSALSTLLGRLPTDLPVPVLVVQHLPDEFMVGLARWLDEVTPLPVHMAQEAMLLEAGNVYLAPGNRHLTVARTGNELVARLVQAVGEYRYCPSVDVLLESVAAVCGVRGAGIILTGMGDDGASGLKILRSAGGRTFAQAQKGCTVFGMPGEAIERGGAEHVVPLETMADAILKIL
ncbi:MAG: chemotaxis-specific protein-glutamate methyltransferase CheB [Anaerolineae bacterium]|nr:chemotaxis-specific protein-glutamate methyltransferase CheB [Anaerolineae bacterium]